MQIAAGCHFFQLAAWFANAANFPSFLSVKDVSPDDDIDFQAAWTFLQGATCRLHGRLGGHATVGG